MDAETLLNPFIALYLLSVIAVYAGFAWWRRRQAAAVQAKRRAAGLDDQVLLNSAVRLERFQTAAATEALVLTGAVIVLPLVWWAIARVFGAEVAGGLALAFAALFLWVLLTATDVGKAFFGGVAFRLLAAYHPPFQVGDRVTLGGHAGKVVEIGIFHVRLQTADDDLVSVPTASLWSAPLVSANAGDRASLCVIKVYLDPMVRAEQWREAENRLWGRCTPRSIWTLPSPARSISSRRRRPSCSPPRPTSPRPTTSRCSRATSPGRSSKPRMN